MCKREGFTEELGKKVGREKKRWAPVQLSLPFFLVELCLFVGSSCVLCLPLGVARPTYVGIPVKNQKVDMYTTGNTYDCSILAYLRAS
jgi:hypothetical protein